MRSKVIVFSLLFLSTFYLSKAQSDSTSFIPPTLGTLLVSSNGDCLNNCLNDSTLFVFATDCESLDFNTNAIPPGWPLSYSATPVSSCASPSLTCDPYYWSEPGRPGSTPFIETASIDVSAGGVVTFDLYYGSLNDTTSCAGPDASNEGVTLQYSPNGGAFWVDMGYWQPSPSFSGRWHTISISIPQFAQTDFTRFRWIQFDDSGIGQDGWGLDNINICRTLPATNWNMGDGNSFTTSSSFNYAYGATGTYVVVATGTSANGTSYFGSTVINVTAPEVSVSVSPTSGLEDREITHVFTFTRSTCMSSSLTVNFSVTGTASINDYMYLLGADVFTPTGGTLTIPAGESSQQVLLKVRQDAIIENDETIILEVDAP
ncbi:MAG: hypothetical protein AAF740_02210 [Bacteroidota bacterium]